MSVELIQVVFFENGGFARVTFAPVGRSRIRIIEVAYSDDENAEDGLWTVLNLNDLTREEMQFLVRQLDLSEVGLNF